METILRLIFVIVIGAFIGGLTNFIAIKMLFRPLQPIYIGKWQLPFSPGVIPKRRGEIATQLGNLVVNHLLTAEMLKNRWEQYGFRNEIEKALINWVKDFFQSEQSLADYCSRFGYPDAPEKLQRFLVEKSQEQSRKIIVKNENRLFRNILPESLQDEVARRIPELANYLTSRVKALVQSEQIRDILERRMEGVVEGKGMFSHMAKTLIGNLHLARWLQEEIVAIIADHRFYLAIEQVLYDEWEKLLDRTIGELTEKLDNGKLPGLLNEVLDLEDLYTKPIHELPIGDFERMIVEAIIPRAVDVGSEKLLAALPRLLDKIDIARIVEDQVNSFSLEELEQLILSFTKRELKMITYFGAYLGGLIGFIQGLMMLLF